MKQSEYISFHNVTDFSSKALHQIFLHFEVLVVSTFKSEIKLNRVLFSTNISEIRHSRS